MNTRLGRLLVVQFAAALALVAATAVSASAPTAASGTVGNTSAT